MSMKKCVVLMVVVLVVMVAMVEDVEGRLSYATCMDLCETKCNFFLHIQKNTVKINVTANVVDFNHLRWRL
ncbi:hypothetical protein AtEden1_Chr1g0052171 [Arabidopsis thaliana]